MGHSIPMYGPLVMRQRSKPHLFPLRHKVSESSFCRGLTDGNGKVANQKGKYLAKKLNKIVKDQDSPKPFVFQNQGSLAYIGDWFVSVFPRLVRECVVVNVVHNFPFRKAIYDRSGAENGIKTKESGRVAWLLWRSAYFTMTLSWRNRCVK
jgi:NADH dehydrogenase FAD-containing subunit